MRRNEKGREVKGKGIEREGTECVRACELTTNKKESVPYELTTNKKESEMRVCARCVRSCKYTAQWARSICL